MLSEIIRFQRWLRRKAPLASTPIHYTNDLKLFFAWLGKLPAEVHVADIDAFIEHSQKVGHAMTTVNRRLAVNQTGGKYPQSMPDFLSNFLGPP